MSRRTARRLLVGLVAFGLAGCGTSPGRGDAPLSTTGDTASVDTVSTPARSPVITDNPNGSAQFTPSDQRPITADPIPTVVGCSWVWFGTLRVDMDLPADHPEGTTVGMSVAVLQGDVSEVGARGILTTHGSGHVSAIVTTVAPTPAPGLDVGVFRFDGQAPGPGAPCEVDLSARSPSGDRPQSSFSLPLQYDVHPPPGASTPFDRLISTIGAPTAPMFLIPELLYSVRHPTFDRLYVAPNSALDSLTLHQAGSCTAITSGYSTSSRPNERTVTVYQAHGCAATDPHPEGTSVADPNWTVIVSNERGATADEAQRVVDTLQRIDIPGMPPATGPATPTPDDWFAAYFADHPGDVELARFSWNDAYIAVVRHDTSIDGTSPLDEYLDPVTFGPGTNLGGTGVGCNEYTFGIATRGYAWFVTPTAETSFSVVLRGARRTIDLQPSAAGPFVGFLDLQGADLQSTAVTVTDRAGIPVACTQHP